MLHKLLVRLREMCINRSDSYSYNMQAQQAMREREETNRSTWLDLTRVSVARPPTS